MFRRLARDKRSMADGVTRAAAVDGGNGSRAAATGGVVAADDGMATSALHFEDLAPHQIRFMRLWLDGFGVVLTPTESRSHMRCTSNLFPESVARALIRSSYWITRHTPREELESRNARLEAGWDESETTAWMLDACIDRARADMQTIPGVISVSSLTFAAAAVAFDAERTSPDRIVSAVRELGYTATRVTGATVREVKLNFDPGIGHEILSTLQQMSASVRWTLQEVDPYYLECLPPHLLSSLPSMRIMLAVPSPMSAFIATQRSLLDAATTAYLGSMIPPSTLRWELSTVSSPAPGLRESPSPSAPEMHDDQIEALLRRDAEAAQTAQLREAIAVGETPLYLQLVIDPARTTSFRTRGELRALRSRHVFALVAEPPQHGVIRVVLRRGLRTREAQLPIEDFCEEGHHLRVLSAAIKARLGIDVRVVSDHAGDAWTWCFAAPEAVDDDTTLTIVHRDATLITLMKNAVAPNDAAARPPKTNVFRAQADESAFVVHAGRAVHHPFAARQMTNREQAKRDVGRIATAKGGLRAHISTSVTHPIRVPPVYRVQMMDDTLARSLRHSLSRRYKAVRILARIVDPRHTVGAFTQSSLTTVPLLEQQSYFTL